MNNKLIKKATYVALSIFVIGLLLSIFIVPDVGPVRIWLLWIFAGITYFAFSWRWWQPVLETQNAARTFFGLNAGNVGPGPTYAPLALITVTPVSAKVEQMEFPAEPQKIFKGELKDPNGLPEGMVPPIRVPFTQTITEAQARKFFPENFTVQPLGGGPDIDFIVETPGDGLDDRVTAEIALIVRLLINDPYKFRRNIGSLDEVFRQIQDELISLSQQYMMRMSIAQAMQNQRWLNIILYHAIERRVGKREDHEAWGIDLQSVQLKMIELDHGLNKSISDAAASTFRKREVLVLASAEKQRLVDEGSGRATAAMMLEEKTLKGRASGQKKLAEDLGITGSEVQAAEVAREIAKGGNAIIFGGDGLAQAASVVTAMVNKGNKPPSPEA